MNGITPSPEKIEARKKVIQRINEEKKNKKK
jgi:hypothetical protein